MFYSKSTSGFYDLQIHGGDIPADAVKITQERYLTLMEGQRAGKKIVADDGYPVLIDPPPVKISIDSVTIRQAKLALLRAGHYGLVEGFINSLEGNEKTAALIEWNAPHVERESAFVAQMAVLLGLSDEDLDELFLTASKL